MLTIRFALQPGLSTTTPTVLLTLSACLLFTWKVQATPIRDYKVPQQIWLTPTFGSHEGYGQVSLVNLAIFGALIGFCSLILNEVSLKKLESRLSGCIDNMVRSGISALDVDHSLACQKLWRWGPYRLR